MNGMRDSTDAWYRLPDGENRERQSLPAIVLFSVARCPQDTTFFPPGFFSYIFFSNAFTTHDPRNDAHQKKNTAHRKERERERSVARDRRHLGKERTGRGDTYPLSDTHKHIQNQYFSWGRGLILRNCLKTEIRYLCYFS